MLANCLCILSDWLIIPWLLHFPFRKTSTICNLTVIHPSLNFSINMFEKQWSKSASPCPGNTRSSSCLFQWHTIRAHPLSIQKHVLLKFPFKFLRKYTASWLLSDKLSPAFSLSALLMFSTFSIKNICLQCFPRICQPLCLWNNVCFYLLLKGCTQSK